VTFAPPGAYGTVNGRSVFTHGVELGTARSGSRSLQTATEELVNSLAGGNPGLRRASAYDVISFAGRRGLRTLLSNRSAANGDLETIEHYTAPLRDGGLFYVLGVAPTDRFREYAGIFDRIVGSLRIND